MKFYKRLPLNRKNPFSNTFAAEADGRLVTNTTNSLQLPKGNIAQRPAGPSNGQIRYNIQLGNNGGELEAYIDGKWEIIKTNRQANITKQEFDNGDYADTLFGPLAYNVSIDRPENVFVYVENVPQIAGTNYTLEYSSTPTPITTSTTLSIEAGPGETLLFVESVADFNPGQPITGSNLDGNTVVDTSATDRTIIISPGASGTVATGTVITTSFAPGTYVRFRPDSLPVPHKPVITLLGFDGYNPPFEV
jgi:hypothetical protein